MGVHRNPKSEEDLILDDKLDMARTLVRLKTRQNARRELNEIEPALVEAHGKELQDGTVSRIDIDTAALFRKSLPEGDPED